MDILLKSDWREVSVGMVSVLADALVAGLEGTAQCAEDVCVCVVREEMSVVQAALRCAVIVFQCPLVEEEVASVREFRRAATAVLWSIAQAAGEPVSRSVWSVPMSVGCADA